MSAPERMCIACRKRADKNQLIRVAAANNTLMIDKTQTMSGRGAYLCFDGKCLQRAADKKLLDRALKTKIAPEEYKSFLTQAGAHIAEAD